MIYTDFARGVLYGVSVVKVTSPFGMRTIFNVYGMHNGIDIRPADRSLAKILAYEKAKVKQVGYTLISGYYIILEHGDDTDTGYRHLAKGSTTVKVGQVIDRNTIIGLEGNTGKVTGSHLHFDIKIKGVWVDPLPYLQGKKAIKPYEDKIIMTRPELPMLKMLVAGVNLRDKPNGADIGNLVKGNSYLYVGKSQVINGYEWAEINVDGKWGFCAIKPEWNTIVMPVVKPFSAVIEKDGLICEVILKAK